MLTMQGVTFAYKKDTVYHDFSWNAQPGKIYGVVGPNGAGKTTLLKCIASELVSYSGTIEYNGNSVKSRDASHLATTFYVPDVQPKFSCTIKELMEYGSFFPKWDAQPLESFLTQQRFEKNTSIKTLSKGYQKQLLFYFALSCNPDLLLLDEITDGIDVASARQLCKDLVAFFNEEKIVIIAAHHIQDFDTLIDEYIVIHHGKIIYSNTRDDILDTHGWIDSAHKASFPEEAILDSRILMGKKQYLVRMNKVSTPHDPVDIVSFFAGLFTKMKGEVQ